MVTSWGGAGKGDSTVQSLWWLQCELWLHVSVSSVLCLKCDCKESAVKPQLKGLFCFLMAGADSGAQRPSGFWLGSLLSARWLQPDVSGVLPTAIYVRQTLVKGVNRNLLMRKGIREKHPPGSECGGLQGAPGLGWGLLAVPLCHCRCPAEPSREAAGKGGALGARRMCCSLCY